MRFFLLIALSSGLGCQHTDVSIDYDTQAPFPAYQFYSWQQPPVVSAPPASSLPPEKARPPAKPASKAPAQENPLMTERVKKAVSTQLQKRGIKPASEAHPADITVHCVVTSKIRTEPPKSRGSVGLGRAGGHTGIGFSIGFPLGKQSAQKDVTILIDLNDASDKQLKWRGSKTIAFADETPGQVNAAIEAAVADIFSFYPPQPARQK